MIQTIARSASTMFLLLYIVASAAGQGLPTAEPEDVGLSSSRLERIDRTITTAITDKEVAGATVLIARQGRTAYYKAFGMADAEAGKGMRGDTIFRIASMTKAVTSVAVMMLYEEGHFLLGDPISKFIPEFRKPRVLLLDSLQAERSGPMPTEPAKRGIRVRDLLKHTAGLTYQWNKHLGKVYSDAEITHGLHQDESTLGEKMKRLAGLPLLFHPGEEHHYSLSVDVLGYLVEVVSGQTLDRFFQERLFGPLAMEDTHFFPPENKLDRLAVVYKPAEGGGIERAPGGAIKGSGSFVYSVDYPYKGPKRYFSGGGGLCSTASDYVRFCQMLLNGGELDGARILSRKSVELMTTDHVKEMRKWNGFGLGFGIARDLAELGESGSVGTFGWGGFFYTQFRIDPLEEMVTIFMAQKHPAGGTKLADRFRALAYQAIID